MAYKDDKSLLKKIEIIEKSYQKTKEMLSDKLLETMKGIELIYTTQYSNDYKIEDSNIPPVIVNISNDNVRSLSDVVVKELKSEVSH